MFKLRRTATLCAAASAISCCLTSCFKEEPLNSECDIESVYVSLSDPNSLFVRSKDTLITLTSIDKTARFNVRPTADISSISPLFVLTPGATISPANGSAQDFTNGPIVYTVTSEDGNWKREYTISFVAESNDGPFAFNDFENPYLEQMSTASFYAWRDYDSQGNEELNWATANAGFAIANSTTAPEDYPTSPIEDGYKGKGVKLVTKSTGSLGDLFGKPIAAGNLFIGTFAPENALQDALSATRFGKPTSKKPRCFSGYYKYEPGPVFKDVNGNVLADRVDVCSIYAVLYRNEDADGNSVTLDGNNVLKSSLLVGTAQLQNPEAAADWTPFEVNFTYTGDVDADILAAKGYNVAIVFSSSAEGDLFNGAIGSTLCVDEVTLEYENDSDDGSDE